MDEQFEAYLTEWIRSIGEELIDVPEEMKAPHRFSLSFRWKLRRRMRKALRESRAAKFPRRHRMRYTVAFSVLLFLSITTAVVCAGRYMLSGFFAEEHSDNTYVWNDVEDAPESIQEIYQPTWLPEGYELFDIDNSNAESHYTWYYCSDPDCDHQDASGHIAFRQYVKKKFDSNMDNEDSELVQITVNGYPGFEHIVNDGGDTLVWNSEEYIFLIDIPLGLNISDAEKMAEFVQKVE